MRLFDAFLNPIGYNERPAGPPHGAEAAGSIIRGVTREVGNELDEFVTSSVRNTLVGLPLDLPAINIARGRSEGIPPLNVVRRQFFSVDAGRGAAAVRELVRVRPGAEAPDVAGELHRRLRHHPTDHDAADDDAPLKRAAAQAADRRGERPLHRSTVGVHERPRTAWTSGSAASPRSRTCSAACSARRSTSCSRHQLEHLQDGDRFYYLQRTDGLNLRFSLEGNSLAELARRNTDAGGTMDIIFNTADFIFDAAGP